ncbi:ABC transporter ATP-binding protein [Terrarubrum flagellatum]|uniref:ABC transporter ATP-binding protein n=1 Tax=Terrirubrum flagellatum TaxID=2895980 RepID=UPI0031454352
MTESLTLSHVSAHYGATRILDDLSLRVEAGELVSLLGASGCGKTTTLRIVAGFLTPTSGEVRLGDRDLSRLPAHKRDIGLVFQNYALFPHLTVFDNVAFGLKQRKIEGTEQRRRVGAMLDRVGLGAFAQRLPAALSGGQKQRVALARALVIEPGLLMFDEPLSNLDAKLRVEMRGEIRELQRANGASALYVTHDQEEAFSISDRVAIMDAGKIVEFNTPEKLYRKPATPFVAKFVGFENLIALSVVERAGEVIVAEGVRGFQIKLDQSAFGAIPDRFTLAARAEGLVVTIAPGSDGVPAKLGLRTYLGRTYQYRCETPAGALLAHGPMLNVTDQDVTLAIDPANCCILAAQPA